MPRLRRGSTSGDSVAPVAVARAAGLHTSRADGAALAYNQDDVLLPDLVVWRPELAEAITGFVRRYWEEHPRNVYNWTPGGDAQIALRRVKAVLGAKGAY